MNMNRKIMMRFPKTGKLLMLFRLTIYRVVISALISLCQKGKNNLIRFRKNIIFCIFIFIHGLKNHLAI